jgi:alpha-tubulin suppressor-like RCC1 family protein
MPPALSKPGSVRQVTAGTTHAVALTSEGNVMCWGDSSSDQCKLPEAVKKRGAVVMLAAGGDQT